MNERKRELRRQELEKEGIIASPPLNAGVILSRLEQDKEQIEDQLEIELGWRYTPQMRHGFKMEKLWDKLVEARYELLEKTR